MSWAMRKNALAMGRATNLVRPCVRVIAGRSAPTDATSRARERSCSIAELATDARPGRTGAPSSGGNAACRCWTLSWIRCMSASTSISGLFASSMISSIPRGVLHLTAGVPVSMSVFTGNFLGIQIHVLASYEIEKRSGALLEHRPPESLRPLARSILDRRAKRRMAHEAEGVQAQFVERAEAEPAHAVLDDLALPAAVDHDRRAAVLHRLHGRHAEV